MNNNFTYPWKVISKFEWKFLPKIFPDSYIHKFALYDEFHLIKVGSSYYEIQTTKTTILPEGNNILTKDVNKNNILQHIGESFSENVKWVIHDGVLFFKTLNWCFKVKVVKKVSSFNSDLITCKR